MGVNNNIQHTEKTGCKRVVFYGLKHTRYRESRVTIFRTTENKKLKHVCTLQNLHKNNTGLSNGCVLG